MTTALEYSVATGARRALHSYWLDTLSRTTVDVGQAVLASMGGDARFEYWLAAIDNGTLHLVRYPASLPGEDIYELTWDNGSVAMAVRVLAANIGLWDAYLPDVPTDIRDEVIEAWLADDTGRDGPVS